MMRKDAPVPSRRREELAHQSGARRTADTPFQTSLCEVINPHVSALRHQGRKRQYSRLHESFNSFSLETSRRECANPDSLGPAA